MRFASKCAWLSKVYIRKGFRAINGEEKNIFYKNWFFSTSKNLHFFEVNLGAPKVHLLENEWEFPPSWKKVKIKNLIKTNIQMKILIKRNFSQVILDNDILLEWLHSNGMQLVLPIQNFKFGLGIFWT